MRKASQALLIIVLAVLAARYLPEESANPGQPGGSAVEAAFADRQSGRMMYVSGRVEKVLPDDNKGDRHQRFILRLESGHTVLVAHNIDVAPRVAGLSEGDTLNLYGQYEWNERGGVMHWTHHAPRGDHEGGWIEHSGRRYE